MIQEAEIGGMWPQARVCWKSPDAGRCEEQTLPHSRWRDCGHGHGFLWQFPCWRRYPRLYSLLPVSLCICPLPAKARAVFLKHKSHALSALVANTIVRRPGVFAWHSRPCLAWASRIQWPQQQPSPDHVGFPCVPSSLALRPPSAWPLAGTPSALSLCAWHKSRGSISNQ